MEVGDYVRTKDGYISKIKELGINIYTDVGCWSKYYVIKSSPNIIDLIEVGDYVNGHRVAEIETLQTKQKLVVVGYGYDADKISENNIKSIVTKEQFESMEYKVC